MLIWILTHLLAFIAGGMVYREYSLNITEKMEKLIADLNEEKAKILEDLAMLKTKVS